MKAVHLIYNKETKQTNQQKKKPRSKEDSYDYFVFATIREQNHNWH